MLLHGWQQWLHAAAYCKGYGQTVRRDFVGRRNCLETGRFGEALEFQESFFSCLSYRIYPF